MFNYDSVQRRYVKGFTTEVHFGKQAKHLSGQPGYDPTKSTITLNIVEIQKLIDRKARTGTWFEPNREVIDFGKIIGIYKNDNGEVNTPTTRGTIHYSKSGCHLVPTHPKE
ncbi:polymorphic toxin type 50 domain-containing protein [Actinotignum sp. GS-2025a]